MVDSIIFDLDGTLWDAGNVSIIGWNEAIKEFGYDFKLTKKDIDATMGFSVEDMADIAFPMLEKKEDRIALTWKCFEWEEKLLAQQGGELMEGMEETIAKLKEKYRLFIVSNCQDGYVQVFLKAHQMEKYFEDFICAGDSGMSKGQNNLLLMREKKLKSPVYIGDTKGDQESAIEAKIPFIYATFGFGEVEDCSYRIDSLREIPSVLEIIADDLDRTRKNGEKTTY